MIKIKSKEQNIQELIAYLKKSIANQWTIDLGGLASEYKVDGKIVRKCYFIASGGQ